MPSFSKQSKNQLAQAHPKLREVLEEAIKTYDFKILDSYRGRADQEKAFQKGTSKAHFGQSAHNYKPCVACDCIPYPFTEADWKNTRRFTEMSNHILAAAKKLKIPIRWGGDWNMDGSKTKNDSWDMPHFELHPWRKFIK